MTVVQVKTERANHFLMESPQRFNSPIHFQRELPKFQFLEHVQRSYGTETNRKCVLRSVARIGVLDFLELKEPKASVCLRVTKYSHSKS